MKNYFKFKSSLHLYMRSGTYHLFEIVWLEYALINTLQEYVDVSSILALFLLAGSVKVETLRRC